jgi:hypothetical protein
MSEELPAGPVIPQSVHRVYLDTGRKAHLVPHGRMAPQAAALCNLRPQGPQVWRGPGGGESKVARAQNLPLCVNCQRMLEPWLPWSQRSRR